MGSRSHGRSGRSFRESRSSSALLFRRWHRRMRVCQPLAPGAPHERVGLQFRHVPRIQIVGFAAGYEATGNPKLRTAVNNFFEIVVQHHGYATGGTSVFERWWGRRGRGVCVWRVLVPYTCSCRGRGGQSRTGQRAACTPIQPRPAQ